MTRLLFLGFFVGLVLACSLAMKACQATQPFESSTGGTAGIVGLPDGSTLTAAKGSVGRGLIDWLESDRAGSASFELGTREFAPRSLRPTVDADSRIPRLTMILKAYPDIDVQVVGHTSASGDLNADLQLSRRRAELVVKELRDGGISGSRLDSSGVGSTSALPAGSPLRKGGETDDRVSLVLTRRGHP